MLITLLWVLAQRHAAAADDYTYNVSDPVYTKLTDKLHRLKREHKPLRLKVNSHTGAGKTYFIRHHDAKYLGCKLLDFDDFEGANRSSALLLAYDACAVLLGSAHLDKRPLPRCGLRLRRAVPEGHRAQRRQAQRSGRRQTPRATGPERDVHRQKAGSRAGKRRFGAGASGFAVFSSFEEGARFCAEAGSV